MIDIHGNGKPNNETDWTESSFSPDFLSMRDNRFDTIEPDDLYEEYSDPLARRRKKSKAAQLFGHPDGLDEPLKDSGSLLHLANIYGTKRIEEVFGWTKQGAGLRQSKFRGLARVGAQFTLTLAAYNLIRLPKLLAAPP